MKNLRKIFAWVLLSPAFLPLVFWSNLIYPFMTPKTLLLRGVGIIALALFVYLAAAGEPFFWSRLKNKFTWLPAALLAVAYATSLIGVDFYQSFWSIFARGDGLLTLTVIALFFYLILLNCDKNFFTTLAKLVALVGSIGALFALLQWFKLSTGIDIPVYADPANRLGGTLGNAAFLAGYLGLSLFATLYTGAMSAGRYKTALYIGAALQLVVIILTATRGSLLALGAMLLGVLIYWGWFRQSTDSLKKYSRMALIILIAASVLFFVFRGALSNVPFEPVQRLATISLTDPTVSSRLFLWKEVGAEALQTPFTGVGAEHIDTLFDRVYDPEAIIEQWFDRTHNSYLDYFVQFGVLGLLLYAALVAAAGYTGWRLWMKGETAGPFLFLVTAIYAIQNFFVFDTGVTLWLFVALFAAGLVLNGSDAGNEQGTTLRIPGAQIIGAVVALGLLFLLVPVVIQPLRANVYLIDGYLNQTADVKNSVASMQTGYDLGTYADLEYGYQVYQMYTGVQLTALKGQDLAAAYQFARQTLESNFNRYPYDARTALYFAHVLDSVPPGQPMDTATLQKALDRTMELSPKRSQAWYIEANLSIARGDAAKSQSEKTKAYEQALSVLEEYTNKVPGAAEPRYVVALLYLTLGDKVSAKEWADKGMSLYNSSDTTTARRALNYYLKIQDWTHAARFLEDIVANDSKDYASTYDLAKISYLLGNIDRAKEMVARLREASPGYVEKDPAFLQALGQ